jgi:signal transduction histidine kinase
VWGVAVPLLLVGLAGTAPAGEAQANAPRAVDALAYLLVLLAVGAVVLRRRWRWAAIGLNALAVGAYVWLGYPFGPILLTVPVLTLTTAVHWPRRRAAAAVAVQVVLVFGASALRVASYGAETTWPEVLRAWTVWSAILAAAFATGSAARVRAESWRGVRAEQAKRAGAEEQLRMAQELHDVVGHGLAVIAMQAGVALHVLDRDPDKARESLEAIRTMSRESLDGLRSELAQLRAGAGDAPERRPLPGPADLELLVQRVRDGGVDVRLEVTGPVAELPTQVGAAAYRIVQESLTNVLRHAGTDAASVVVRASDTALEVEVTDRGSGGSPGAGGSGISGMRERAVALGGTLDAGPVAAGGFQVRAVLPLSPVTSEPVP